MEVAKSKRVRKQRKCPSWSDGGSVILNKPPSLLLHYRFQGVFPSFHRTLPNPQQLSMQGARELFAKEACPKVCTFPRLDSAKRDHSQGRRRRWERFRAPLHTKGEALGREHGRVAAWALWGPLLFVLTLFSTGSKVFSYLTPWRPMEGLPIS